MSVEDDVASGGRVVDLLQRAGGLLGQLGAGLDFAGAGRHGLDRGFGALLDLGDEGGDLLGGAAGALGELANLVRDDGEALALLAGSGRFDGRVQGEQVGLLGDVVDRLDDGPDLVALAPSSVTGGRRSRRTT
jgi:hypothetical protein